MSNTTIPMDHDAISQALNDPIMQRIVTILNIASLSILELFEYALTRPEINRAMSKGVIEFEKRPPLLTSEATSGSESAQHILDNGDYYFGLLSTKVKLTKFGLYLLEIMETDEKQSMNYKPPPQSVESEISLSDRAPHL